MTIGSKMSKRLFGILSGGRHGNSEIGISDHAILWLRHLRYVLFGINQQPFMPDASFD